MFSLNDVGFLGSLAAAPAYDADAQAYITAVEAADTQALEVGVKDAINAFIVGCKADGIWTAIKASCILAGARTLSGALVPLVGAAPTKNGTEGDWNYNRETGLKGNTTNNYLDSNRANNADPQDNAHMSCYVTELASIALTVYMGAVRTSPTPVIVSQILDNNGPLLFSLNNGTTTATARTGKGNTILGLFGINRASSASVTTYAESTAASVNILSNGTLSFNHYIFCRNLNGSPATFGNRRLAFYSIGESLDLALLDTRVTTLINAIAAAIP